MSGVQAMSASLLAKGNSKACRELEKSLHADKDDHVTRFALVRLLAGDGEWAAAEGLLRGPGVGNLLADPITRVAHVSSFGGAYLALWRARGHYVRQSVDRNNQGDARTPECRLDISAERTVLLHTAQEFLEEALAAPENLNDPVIRAQVAFCKEARGDCAGALSIYARIIADSPLSPGTSAVIFRTSVLLSHVGRFDECVRYLEFIEGDPPKNCSRLLIETLQYRCNTAMGLDMKVSRRLPGLREAFNDEFTAGRMGNEFSREDVPWDRLPGWFCMWRELGVQSVRGDDYFLGVQMLSQALQIKEDAETLVCVGETLWVLGDSNRALQHWERAYAADPSHAGAKRRLAEWAPEKWRDRISKEDDRRNAVAEMQRLAERSSRKADAMIARRRRREKARIFNAWRRIHHKTKYTVCRILASTEAKAMSPANRQQTRESEGGVPGRSGHKDDETRRTVARRVPHDGTRSQKQDNASADRDSSSSPSPSSSSSSSSSASGSGSSSSDQGSGSSLSAARISVSTLSSDSTRAIDQRTGLPISVQRWTFRPAAPSALAPDATTDGSTDVCGGNGVSKPHGEKGNVFIFPIPSALEAKQAGRANFAASFQAEKVKVKQLFCYCRHGQPVETQTGDERTAAAAAAAARLDDDDALTPATSTSAALAPPEVAAKLIREAMVAGCGYGGGGGVPHA